MEKISLMLIHAPSRILDENYKAYYATFAKEQNDLCSSKEYLIVWEIKNTFRYGQKEIEACEWDKPDYVTDTEDKTETNISKQVEILNIEYYKNKIKGE